MKLAFTVITSEPNQGHYFSISKDDSFGLNNLEDYLGVRSGSITTRQWNSISTRINKLNNGEKLMIEGA